MTADWVWDDESQVPHDERLLRRVRRKPDCVVINLTTKKAELKAGALIFDNGSGMSVHRESVRHRLGVPMVDLCDWDMYHAVEFEARTVRSAECPIEDEAVQVGGVIHENDPDDDRLGEAHALVRTRSSSLPRQERRAIRDRIVDSHEWVAEDPNCPSR